MAPSQIPDLAISGPPPKTSVFVRRRAGHFRTLPIVGRCSRGHDIATQGGLRCRRRGALGGRQEALRRRRRRPRGEASVGPRRLPAPAPDRARSGPVRSGGGGEGGSSCRATDGRRKSLDIRGSSKLWNSRGRGGAAGFRWRWRMRCREPGARSREGGWVAQKFDEHRCNRYPTDHDNPGRSREVLEVLEHFGDIWKIQTNLEHLEQIGCIGPGPSCSGSPPNMAPIAPTLVEFRAPGPPSRANSRR